MHKSFFENTKEKELTKGDVYRFIRSQVQPVDRAMNLLFLEIIVLVPVLALFQIWSVLSA